MWRRRGKVPGGPESEGVGVNNRDVFVALEIVEVESQDPRHLVNAHRRNDSSIVNLNPRDSILKHEPPPCGENFRRLGENSENRVDGPG